MIETPPAPALKKELLLSNIAERYYQSFGEINPKTLQSYKDAVALFIEAAGNREITDYKKEDVRHFQDILMRLPPNWRKHSRFNNKSLEQVAEISHKEGLKSLSPVTVNKYIGGCLYLWGWANKNYDEINSNPFQGFTVKNPVHAKDQRQPFTSSELKSIFTAPIYTGYLSARSWDQRGDIVDRASAKFWVPLISLYSGARLSEICQLYTEDIKQENDIYYFDINEDKEDKKLKTRASHRRIPIHHTLVSCGLLDFVDHRKTGRLFPDIVLSNDGYYSSTFSKHFNRFLKSCSVKTGRNGFHSFRHNFEDVCRDAGVSLEVTNALQGHVTPGTSERYHSRYSIESLDEALQRIEYKDLNLDHLRLSSGGRAIHE